MRTGDRREGPGGSKLATLFEYWKSKADGRHLPARRDIDPVNLPRHLSSLMLIDDIGEDGPHRYRFRLIGTALARLLVRDPTARPLDEVLDDSELEAIDGEVIVAAGEVREGRRGGRGGGMEGIGEIQ